MWEILLDELSKFSALVFLFLVPSCVLGLKYRQRLGKPFRILVVYLCFNLVIEIGARILGYTVKNNLPLLHLYTFGELLLWSLFYREILARGTALVRHFKWITGIALLVIVFNSLFVQGLLTFNSYAKTLAQLMVIFYASSYAFNFLLDDGPDTPEKKLLRQVNAAVLVYYCGSLFIFMFSKFRGDKADYQLLWNVNIVLNLFFQILVFISLCQAIFKPPK